MTDGGPAAPAPRRRSRRGALILVITLFALAAILVGLDRLAAAYAENRIAQEIQGQGFPSRPAVTVRGFPFLTQLISRNLDGIDVRASGLREGPVVVSLDVLATGIRLNSGYNGGTAQRVAGTGLVAFSSLASLASAAGAPGLTVTAAGPHELKFTANLDIITATAIARITPAGPRTFRVQVVSVDGLPPSLLDPVRDFTVEVPPLPLGLAIRRVSVSAQGIVIHITGSNVSFGQ